MKRNDERIQKCILQKQTGLEQTSTGDLAAADTPYGNPTDLEKYCRQNALCGKNATMVGNPLP